MHADADADGSSWSFRGDCGARPVLILLVQFSYSTYAFYKVDLKGEYEYEYEVKVVREITAVVQVLYRPPVC